MTCCTVHTAADPPLTETPRMLDATVELKPDDTAVCAGDVEATPVMPVTDRRWVMRLAAWMTAEVPEPTERKVTMRSITPSSTTFVPAMNVIVASAASAVVPAVPNRTMTMGVAVPAPVFDK